MATTTEAQYERNTGTGLSDSTHTSSSSSSAERYRLDECDDRPILLYKYRGRLQTSSQKDLCAWLDKGKPALLRFPRPRTALTYSISQMRNSASPRSPLAGAARTST